MRVLLISNSLSHNIVEPIGENLASNGHEVTLIRHPLTRSDDRRTIHVVSAGEIRLLRQKYIRARPPFSYFFDLFWPVTLSNFEVVISFACHNTLRALWLRRLQRVKYVIHWNIDFSPRRFSSSFANRLYDSLDKFAVQNSDAHFELTETALLARLSRYVMSRRDTDLVSPVGIESNRVPTIDVMRFEKKKIVFLGNLSEHQGVSKLLLCFPRVLEVFPDAQLDVIGAGYILQELKSLSYALEIDHAVTFHGHLNQSEFRSILERSCLGAAPFLRTPTSFSTFADPSKIKSYIEAGLPVLMSDVPEIAKTLSEKQCGVICEPDESSMAEAIVQILSSREDWIKLAQNVRDYSIHLDWRETLKPLNMILTRI